MVHINQVQWCAAAFTRRQLREEPDTSQGTHKNLGQDRILCYSLAMRCLLLINRMPHGACVLRYKRLEILDLESGSRHN